MTVILTREQQNEIRDQSGHAYNEEACGLLIGREDRSQGDGPNELEVHVVEIRPMENTKNEDRERRYLIDPMVLMKLEDELETSEWDLVGIYHSHPDHPARPSEFDQDHALPGLSYLIHGVSEGTPTELTSWRLSDDRKTFHPEPIKIKNDAPQD